jgi:hypothetical protein
MTTATGTQTDFFAWAQDLERENKRIAEINAQRGAVLDMMLYVAILVFRL